MQSRHNGSPVFLATYHIRFAWENTTTGDKGPELPGYSVINAFAEYTPMRMENLKLRAEVNNILDESYSSRATYGQEFAGEVVPLQEPGRSLRLSVDMTF